MKLRRRPKTPAVPTARQRVQRDTTQLQPPAAFSYRSRHRTEAEAPKPARAAHLGRFWLQRFGLIVLLLAIVVSTINALTLSPQAKVLPLTSGSDYPFLQDATVYEAAAHQLLVSSIWNRNKITVDSGHLSQALRDQFPELASVTVTLPLLAHQPLVYIVPAQPALDLVTGSGAFIIDASGKVLLKTQDTPAFRRLELPVVHDQSGLQVRLNHQALPGQSVSFIQAVLAQLAAKHLSVAALTLPATASELDVQLTGQPYFVKFNLQSHTAREQAGTFLATIANLQRQNITPAHYIDVRVEGRAYYQ